jgi:hypothetical protein
LCWKRTSEGSFFHWEAPVFLPGLLPRGDRGGREDGGKGKGRRRRRGKGCGKEKEKEKQLPQSFIFYCLYQH